MNLTAPWESDEMEAARLCPKISQHEYSLQSLHRPSIPLPFAAPPWPRSVTGKWTAPPRPAPRNSRWWTAEHSNHHATNAHHLHPEGPPGRSTSPSPCSSSLSLSSTPRTTPQRPHECLNLEARGCRSITACAPGRARSILCHPRERWERWNASLSKARRSWIREVWVSRGQLNRANCELAYDGAGVIELRYVEWTSHLQTCARRVDSKSSTFLRATP